MICRVFKKCTKISKLYILRVFQYLNLQVIALCHALMENSELTGVSRVLVVSPVNTVLNWKAEFKKWLPRKVGFEIFELTSCKQTHERKYRVSEWYEEGGVLILGYTMFRNISNPSNKAIQKKVKETFQKGLVDPGKDHLYSFGWWFCSRKMRCVI